MPRIDCRPDVVFPELLEARLQIPGAAPSDPWRDIAVVPLTWDWLGWGRYGAPLPNGNGHVHLNLTCRGEEPNQFGLYFTLYGQTSVSDFLLPAAEQRDPLRLEFTLDVPGRLLAEGAETVPLRIVIAAAADQTINPDEPHPWLYGLMSGGTSDSGCDVTGISPNPALIAIGSSQTFTAQGFDLGSVTWQSDDSQPSSGSGSSFSTTWNNSGDFLVFAACNQTQAQAQAKVVKVKEIVVESGGTQISGSTQTPPNTNISAAIREEGEQLIVRAVLDPNLGENDLGDLVIEWTGGEAVPGKKLQRAVSKDQTAKITVTAQLGTSSATMLAYIIWATRTGFRPNGQRNDDPFPNFSGRNRNRIGMVGPSDNGGFTTTTQSQFTIQPVEFINDGINKVFDKSYFRWDLRREGRALKLLNDGTGWRVVTGTGHGPLPANSTANWASDDRAQNDELLDPWAPSRRGELYIQDIPGWNSNPGNIIAYRKYLNFREWATVHISSDGTHPRRTNFDACSDRFLWHAHRAVEFVDAGTDSFWREIAAGTNHCGEGNTWDFTLPPEVAANFPTITTQSPLPNGQVGVAYQQTIVATVPANLPNATLVFALAQGALPPGLTLNTTSGVISGTPTQAGTYTFFVQVQASNQQPPSAAVAQFVVTITP